ncbi:glycosyltransferase family 39 protein [Gryllotalpicola ginsengisoli]|uniref:glycosyltransferase family 39 protein n=1 Tax=Gryllotalpicola ginsengisoli TaxID=444608 RepID=UPI0003B523EE|nr:glycosyltransferase family 39 protein [Gryllotalpicola ginsengisoli]
MTTVTSTLTAAAPRTRRRSTAAALPAAAGAATVIATAFGTWIPSLWGDEAASALSAQRSLPSFLHEIVHVDAVHAVYYAALHLWVAVFGASAFSLRFPSAIAIGVTVAGLIVLVRQFGGGRRLQLVAATLAALSPRLDYAGTEARSYAWTAAFATWIAIAGVAAVRGRAEPRRAWLVYGGLLAAGTALNVFTASLALAIGCFAALHPRRAVLLRAWAATSAAALLCASPVLVLAALQRQQVAFLAHRPTPPVTWLQSGFFDADPIAAVIGWALVALALAVAVRGRLRGAHLVEHSHLHLTGPRLGRRPGLTALAALWGGIPFVGLVATIPVLHNYAPRYITFATPAVVLLIALGIEAVFRSWRAAGITALALTVAASVPAYAHWRTPYAQNESDWAQVAELIGAHARAGDQLAFDTVVRSSRRPVNSMRLYPADYRGLAAPQLVAPWYETASWHDDLMTIEHAAEQGRFTARRVFAVESDFPGEGLVDADGIRSLEAAGYRVVRHWSLHSDEVFELHRDATGG